MQDALSNFLNKLKLANRARKELFPFPASRYIAAVAAALERAGYIASAEKRGKKSRPFLEIRPLLYQVGAPKVAGIKRISRLSKRVYLPAREIRTIRNGYGSLILSTPKGVLTDKEARAAGVGGEALFEIW